MDILTSVTQCSRFHTPLYISRTRKDFDFSVLLCCCFFKY